MVRLMRRGVLIVLFAVVACSGGPSIEDRAGELANIDGQTNTGPYVRLLSELDAKCSQDAGKIVGLVESDVGFLGSHGQVVSELQFMRLLERSPGSDCEAAGLAIVNSGT